MTGIDLTIESGVATMLLNRPALGNRYDPALLSAMAGHLERLAAAPEVRAVVLRGAGRHFCVGADIGWHEAPAGEAGPDFLDVLLALDALPRPVIGVVQGACIGGGLGFAACCDIVLAERGAVFAIPEIRLGLCPAALIPIFQRAIGARAFRRYGLTGERFSAETAQRLGLVAELFDDDSAAALAPLVDALRLGGPEAIARSKALAAAPFDVAQMRAHEAAFMEARLLPEAVEGLAAFREKRPPRWYREPSS